MYPKSRAEMGVQVSPTFELRRSGFPDAAADRKTSHSVRISAVMFSPSDGAAILFPRESYAVGMAFALALGTLLAIAGLLVTSVQGFAVAAGLHGSAVGPLAKALVTRHVGFAIPAVMFSLFSQSMVIFYFIGTGRLVKDDTARFPEAERRRILSALSDLSAGRLPPRPSPSSPRSRSSFSAARSTRTRCRRGPTLPRR